MAKIRLSVVMSCYNASLYLHEAIGSTLAQTLRDFEFIVIDDGSTDDTICVISHYAENDNRIKIIKKSNTGLTDSLNIGIREASGEYIARMDADDVSDPMRLEMQMNYLMNNKDIVLLGTGCTEINGTGSIIKKHTYPLKHSQLLRRLQTLQSFFPHASAVFKREDALKVNGYNNKFVRSQDCDLWLRLSERYRMACLPDHLLRLRRHEKQISNENRGKLQATMGIAAVICYFIRAYKASDPSAADVTTWEQFIDWLHVKLEKCGYFKYTYTMSILRNKWSHETHSAGNITKRLFVEMRDLILSGYAVKTLIKRYCGSNLFDCMAKQWIALNIN